ncbi:MAG: molybdopterin oxidoreductase, iron-sulfur binding subunit [Planctomycetaceae bacterium]|nr:molybdopterin oxidoreductase, iron-sulfur binding subunit [Planctomycetaceae bacterium]
MTDVPQNSAIEAAAPRADSTQPAETLAAALLPVVERIDWNALRDRTNGPAGEEPLWRSLDELSAAPEFFDYLHREFPRQAGEWTDPATRRSFLKLMAASLGLAGVGLSGCVRQPEEKIVPYVRQPEDAVPGKPAFYATCTTLGGYATGLLVESHLGRPTKIEGNPEHPASLGATDIFAQASILSLYDPDRSQTVMRAGRISTWSELLTLITAELPALRARHGRGLAILTETITSPTLADQLQTLIKELPEARWHQYEPLSRDNVRAGAKQAFGEYVETIYHFDRADVVLTLDAEFLTNMPGNLRYAREFMDHRRLARTTVPSGNSKIEMNRLYAVESTPGLTGAAADHRLPLRASEIEGLTRALAARLGVEVTGSIKDAPNGIPKDWFATLIADLHAHQGSSLVIAGDGQPSHVHALVHAINRQLKNVGRTVEYIPPVAAEPVDQLGSLRELIDRMQQGDVKLLVILGGNPVYTAPGELEFATAVERVDLRIHLAPYFDETSSLSHWHVPSSHELEAWGDARAFDGTATIQQPLIAPLFSSKTAHDLVAALAGHPEQTAYQIIQKYWTQRLGSNGFLKRWKRAVHDGVVAGTRADSRKPEWKFVDQIFPAESTSDLTASHGKQGLEITFGPDPTIWDGRFANSGWLQELPKPITKLTWDNAAFVSPQTAERLGISNQELVDLSLGERTLRVPVWIVPGQPNNSISLSLGYGRTHCGRIGKDVGVNASDLRPARHAWFATGVEVTPTGARYPLSVTQNHHSMEGRDLVRVATLAEFTIQPEFIDLEHRHPEQSPTLYAKYEESENAWGMVIDQTACIGCNACVVACQAENNIPIVGKEQISIGREMHWLRIDRYYRGEIDAPDTYFQPVMCVHCENAPCELVCPVAATVHSHEGLNQMVYNRCVGTRYCSNNCPYKVRRFNFLDYDAHFNYGGEQASALKLLRNPDVTVRSRGVMEKCTYCIQRISEAKIEAQKENRPVRDGEIVTACQQSCPTQAIVFGNIRDPKSGVAKLKESPLNYSLLGELNTLPRTTHLARIRNPHPSLEGPATIDTPAIKPTK